MSELNDKLLEIKRQKDTYILPENLKKDVTAFGITGTLDSGVKLFETLEEMQLDPSPNEGDLAVVYREEIQPIIEESEFDSCIFPNTVVLDTAFSDSIYGRFRAVDPSVMFDGMVEVSSSRFRFNGYGDEMIRVEYTSQDGITYTRTDGGEELQEFGTTIKWENYEPFNSVIGNFMKIGGNYFEGLYQYTYNKTNNFSKMDIHNFSIENNILNVPILNEQVLSEKIDEAEDTILLLEPTLNTTRLYCNN